MTGPVRKALEAACDWAAYHLVLHWPWRWTDVLNRKRHLGAAIYWAMLPFAGNWAYRHEVAEINAAALAAAKETPSE